MPRADCLSYLNLTTIVCGRYDTPLLISAETRIWTFSRLTCQHHREKEAAFIPQRAQFMTGMVEVEREKWMEKEDLYVYGVVPRDFYQTG